MNLVLRLQMSYHHWPRIQARTPSRHQDHRQRLAAAQSTEKLQDHKNPNEYKSTSMRKQNLLPQWTRTTQLTLILMSMKSSTNFVRGYEDQNQLNNERKMY